MSYTATGGCLEPARRRCADGELLVLLVFATHVNQADVEAGRPWISWPKQETIAAEAGISDRTVRRRIAALVECGDLKDTGVTVGRGARKYQITIAGAPGGPESLPDTGQPCPTDRTTLSDRPEDLGRAGRTALAEEPEGNRKPEPETEPATREWVSRLRRKEREDTLSGLEDDYRKAPKETTLRAIESLELEVLAERLGIPDVVVVDGGDHR